MIIQPSPSSAGAGFFLMNKRDKHQVLTCMSLQLPGSWKHYHKKQAFPITADIIHTDPIKVKAALDWTVPLVGSCRASWDLLFLHPSLIPILSLPDASYLWGRPVPLMQEWVLFLSQRSTQDHCWDPCWGLVLTDYTNLEYIWLYICTNSYQDRFTLFFF